MRRGRRILVEVETGVEVRCAMSMLNPHDWRLDSDDEGKPRVHVRPLADADKAQECVRFTCLRCQHELFLQRVGYRQPPKYGCQGES